MPQRSRQAQKRLDFKIKQKLNKASAYGQLLRILIAEEDNCSGEICFQALSRAKQSGRGNLGRSKDDLAKCLKIIEQHASTFNVRQLSKTFRVIGTFREIPGGDSLRPHVNDVRGYFE